jgi:hypothetical protein
LGKLAAAGIAVGLIGAGEATLSTWLACLVGAVVEVGFRTRGVGEVVAGVVKELKTLGAGDTVGG